MKLIISATADQTIDNLKAICRINRERIGKNVTDIDGNENPGHIVVHVGKSELITAEVHPSEVVLTKQSLNQDPLHMTISKAALKSLM